MAETKKIKTASKPSRPERNLSLQGVLLLEHLGFQPVLEPFSSVILSGNISFLILYIHISVIWMSTGISSSETSRCVPPIL